MLVGVQRTASSHHRDGTCLGSAALLPGAGGWGGAPREAPKAQPFANINLSSPQIARGRALIPGLPPLPAALSPLLPEPAWWGDGEPAQRGDRDAAPAPDPVRWL